MSLFSRLLLLASLLLTTACGPSIPAGEIAVKPKAETPSTVTDLTGALTNPQLATLTAPDRFQVLFDTTQGTFTVSVDRSLSPNGADRFYNLVKMGFYDDVACFRVIDGFIVQFGLNGDPAVNAAWENATIPDDPVAATNVRGTLTFATAGPNTRTTQLFINLGANQQLDRMGFSPFGAVTEGMDVVERLYGGYGEGAPTGSGPNQTKIQEWGNDYLRSNFDKLDYLTTATVIEP